MDIYKQAPAEWAFNPENTRLFKPVKGTAILNIVNPLVKIPTVDEVLEYTGEVISPVFVNYDTEKMTMSGDLSATDAGSYDTTFTLIDPTAKWEDGTTDPVHVIWAINPIEPIVTPDTAYHIEFNELLSSVQITGEATFNGVEVPGTFSWLTTDEEFVNLGDPAVVSWKFTSGSSNFKSVTGTISIDIDEIDIEGVPTIAETLSYTGEEQTPSWNGYDPEQLTISGDISATEVGIYNVTFTPTEKYEWPDGTKDSKTVQWSIERAVINEPTIVSQVSYTGNVITPTITGFDSNTMDISGDQEATAIGSYSVTITPKSSYCWPDKSVEAITLNWSIIQLTANIPTVSGTKTYNGNTQTPTFINYDSNKMTMSGDTNGIDAGTYTVTFTLKDNYVWSDGTSEPKTVNWVIKKQSVTVPTASNTSLTYNGSQQTKTFNNYNSSLMTVSGNSATNAGTHSATFVLKDVTNYQWSDGTMTNKTVNWTIAKQSISKPTVVSTSSYTYDGSAKTVITNIDSKLSVSGNVSATNAGSYTATVSLPDTTNYQWSDGSTTAITKSWSITKATISGFKITPNTTSLEGAGTVTFTLTGIPSGLSATVKCNNTSYNPTGSGNSRSVSLPNADATYRFTATIAESTNYKSATATCQIIVTKTIELPNVDGGIYLSNGYWETGISTSVSGNTVTMNANSFPNLAEVCTFDKGSDSISIDFTTTWYADGSNSQNGPISENVVNVRIPTAIVNQIDERMQYARDNGHHDFEVYVAFPDYSGINYDYDLWNYKKSTAYSGGYLTLNVNDYEYQ